VAAAAAAAAAAAGWLAGWLQVLETEPWMAAEDFAFFGQVVPSSFMFVGIRNDTVGSVHNLHRCGWRGARPGRCYDVTQHVVAHVARQKHVPCSRQLSRAAPS